MVKQIVRRPRPAALLAGTRGRGRDAAGLGYLSGHAGVAVALGAAALPHLSRAGCALALTAIPVVGLTRIYVGAHLPLDIAGGAALGVAVEAAVSLAKSRTSCASRTLRQKAFIPSDHHLAPRRSRASKTIRCPGLFRNRAREQILQLALFSRG